MSTTIDLTSPSPQKQKKTKKRDLLDYYSLGKCKSKSKRNKNDNAGNGKKKKNLPKSGDILSVKAYLNVPFSEKDEAKELGAWWDAKRKQWYVRPNKDLRPFARWNPVPEFQCLNCGDMIQTLSVDGGKYACGFCEMNICGKCLPINNESSWRCDSCGAHSCNAMGTGNKKCPQFYEKNGYGPDMPLCGNFGRGGCSSGY